MASKSSKENSRENKPRVNSQQKKLRRQQILMSIVGIILVLTMVLALLFK
jgi:predicted nucleic acid-binding Zn ribbon protein